jgi:hypothetical protein
VCAVCSHPVTTEEERIEVDGKHAHVCVNPHGILYRIECFRDAPGCTGVGDPETFWSWFPGCSWQVGLCAGCGEHLGWRFRSADEAFVGLLPERLARGEEPSPP